MILEWRDNLSIGIKKIDDQHRSMFEHLNKFFSSCGEGKCHEEIIHILDFLESYVIEHFQDEEQLQKKYDYPDYEQHKLEHEKLMQDVKILKNGIDKDFSKSELVLQVNDLVINWIINHLSKTDRDFGIFLRNKIKQGEEISL